MQLDISSGAITLIAIALENDRRNLLATNAALKRSLDVVRALPKLCRKSLSDAWKALELVKEPTGFLEFCALILNSIDRRLRNHPGRAAGKWSDVSDFDHGVFLALGQTLAEAAVSGDSRDEPSLDDALKGLAAAEPAHLQKRLVANYLGNLLQDYFDSCKIRISMPDLPPETEESLRYMDATNLAEAIFAQLDLDATNGYESQLLASELADALGEIAGEENR